MRITDLILEYSYEIYGITLLYSKYTKVEVNVYVALNQFKANELYVIGFLCI